MKEMKYKHLFTPIKMNSVILKNRILSTPAGQVDEKARGGAAVVMNGSMAVDCDRSFWRKESPYPFSKYEKEKYKQQVNIAHYHGAKIAAELFHAGVWCIVPEDDFAWGPSDTYLEAEKRTIKALTEEEMEVICKAYAKSAKDALELGYDILFIHFAHGWLASSFLSPYFNKRTDQYGGSIENRSRFPLMILKAIREAVGPNVPIDMRINADDRLEGDTIKFEDVITFCQWAEEYVDSINVSSGQDIIHEGNVHAMSLNLYPEFYNVDYAIELKKHLKKALVYPVCAILDFEKADQLIGEGKIDMIGIGRGVICDPDMPTKLCEGKLEDVRPCVRCNYCYHIATNRGNIGCTVNPTALRQIPKEIIHVDEPKHVVIIGAGPAGINAALAADQAGHQVTLIEKESEVGGLLRYISLEYYKNGYKRYLKYLKTQLAKSKVNIILNTKADREYVESLNPDKIIIAIGGELVTPRIEGVHQPHVLDCLTAISQPDKIKDKVVIVGGGVVGIEIALELANIEKKDVTVVEMSDELVSTANMLYKVGLNQELRKSDIKVMKNTTCTRINEHSVEVRENNELKYLDADTVIIAVGIRSKSQEAHEMYGITPYTDMVGDVVKPRVIMEATFEGYSAGNRK